MKKNINRLILCCLLLLTIATGLAVSAEPNASPVFKQEELGQILAPIALYPDSLISQVLMASTYPLEVVQADRWAKQNKDLGGSALTVALENKPWDPSVKSLVNFPQVLTMMSEKLDWTQKLGDAFITQQKDVLNTIQTLRNKAQEQGSLKTTEQQIITVEPNVVVIESANPEEMYVPTYDSEVVYGTWPYVGYPPYQYYPSGYFPRVTPYSLGLGVAAGAAWGYAWGRTDWNRGDLDIDINRNANLNQGINRDKYAQQYRDQGRLDQTGKGKWQHSPEHRKGVAYRDQATAQKFNRASPADAVKSREAFRGRAEQGRQELASGDAGRLDGRPQTGRQGDFQARDRAATRDVGSRAVSDRSNAFQDMNRGSSARKSSSRGQASRQSMSRPSGGRGGGGRGGGGRGGGGRR